MKPTDQQLEDAAYEGMEAAHHQHIQLVYQEKTPQYGRKPMHQLDHTSIGRFDVCAVEHCGHISTQFRQGPRLLFELDGSFTQGEKKSRLADYLSKDVDRAG